MNYSVLPQKWQDTKNTTVRTIVHTINSVGNALSKWKLDLDVIVPFSYKPCDFNEYLIIEAVWLPYKNDKGKIEVKPSLLIKTKLGKVSIERFDDPELSKEGELH